MDNIATQSSTKSVSDLLGQGIHKGLLSFWMLCKIMVPVYIIVNVLNKTPVLPWVAEQCAPLMDLFGLPGGAATAIVIGMTINIYACVAATAALNLTAEQMTVVAVMIGISHNNIMETAILQKTGAPIVYLVPMRFIAALGLGWLVAFAYGMV